MHAIFKTDRPAGFFQKRKISQFKQSVLKARENSTFSRFPLLSQNIVLHFYPEFRSFRIKLKVFRALLKGGKDLLIKAHDPQGLYRVIDHLSKIKLYFKHHLTNDRKIQEKLWLNLKV